MKVLDEYCAFNRIYKLDNNLNVGQYNVADIRTCLSEAMANYLSASELCFDAISPIPNTGGYYTEVISEITGLPELVVFKKEILYRTFDEYSGDRKNYYDKHLKFVGSEACKDLRILFVDEALISGLTIRQFAKACKVNGIRNYSFAFMSPLNHLSCPFGHIVNKNRQFSYENGINYDDKIEDFKKEVDAQSMIFLPYSDFSHCVGGNNVCKLCFSDHK